MNNVININNYVDAQIFYLLPFIFFLVSIFLSFKYSFFIGDYIGSWLNSNQQVSQIFAGLIIFTSSITIFSLIQNMISFNKEDKDFGNKFLGSVLSLFLSNLILTLVVSESFSYDRSLRLVVCWR